MNMYRMRIVSYFLFSLLVLSSCVRDDIQPCPPLQVHIVVKDKNYFNVDKVELEERKSEDLAFREYVPTLYYMLRDAATGEIVEEQGVFEVTSDGQTFPVTFCNCLPHGRYILTVWGGLKDLKPFDENGGHTTITFHPGHTEGNDIYMTNDTLLYDAWNYDYTVEMERTKGKLIIQAVNLPDGIRWSDKTVSGLYGALDYSFHYSDMTSVYTRAGWETGEAVVTRTVLTPSIRKDGSVLDVNFYDSEQRETPTLIPKDVNITMKRNELTVLRYVYGGNGDFTIYILVNDNWEEIHGMEID